MARLRKFAQYKKFERPYTRVSKFRKKAFIKITPNTRVVTFEMGNLRSSFPYVYHLISEQNVQIRDNALESARNASNKIMEKGIGTSMYKLKLKVYPFHIMRENPLATGAGADRFSKGMAHSFGKPIGQAARIRKGQTVIECSVNKEHLDFAKRALSKASSKLPLCYKLQLKERAKTI